ncbi:hypothetical protein [Albidovulum sp.]|uniref:hypothetical protein n=1 Tax=Albidovulum sp. TaxID=1872424 RepID=UPI0039B86608
MTVHARARVSLNQPQSPKAAEDFAERAGVSLSEVIALALAGRAGAARAADFFAGRGQGGDAARAVARLEGRAG